MLQLGVVVVAEAEADDEVQSFHADEGPENTALVVVTLFVADEVVFTELVVAFELLELLFGSQSLQWPEAELVTADDVVGGPLGRVVVFTELVVEAVLLELVLGSQSLQWPEAELETAELVDGFPVVLAVEAFELVVAAEDVVFTELVVEAVLLELVLGSQSLQWPEAELETAELVDGFPVVLEVEAFELVVAAEDVVGGPLGRVVDVAFELVELLLGSQWPEAELVVTADDVVEALLEVVAAELVVALLEVVTTELVVALLEVVAALEVVTAELVVALLEVVTAELVVALEEVLEEAQSFQLPESPLGAAMAKDATRAGRTNEYFILMMCVLQRKTVVGIIRGKNALGESERNECGGLSV